MKIVETFEERGGGMHNCMTGCIVKCSNIVHDADGNYKTRLEPDGLIRIRLEATDDLGIEQLDT